MERFRLGRPVIGALVAMGMLAGCGGAGTTASVPSALTSNTVHHATSSSGDLLYVGNTSQTSEFGSVYFLAYPSGKPVGRLTGFEDPRGICSDKSGNVFITDDEAEDVVEYPHGGTTPIETLSSPHEPYACAVDSLSGNLAVANKDGTVDIYKNESGHPRHLSAPFRPYFACYDTSGNLYLDGTGDPFAVAELPKEHASFKRISLRGHTTNHGPAGVQWYGNHLVPGSATPQPFGGPGRTYRYEIVGNIGKQGGTMAVQGGLDDFVIYQSVLIATRGNEYIQLFSYPKGGTPIKTVEEPGSPAFGVAISVAPSRSRIHKKER